MKTDDQVWNIAISLYLSIVEMFTVPSMDGLRKHDYIGKLIKFWRGTLDTDRVTRIVDGRQSRQEVLEIDMFLRCLEKVHRETTKLFNGERNAIHNPTRKKGKKK